MDFAPLDQLINRSFEIGDNGFTEKVIASLPPPPMTSARKAQVLTWLCAFSVVLALVVYGFNNSFPTGGLTIMVIVALSVALAQLELDWI